MRTLFAGPYYGEFGHEVLGTGLLRAVAVNYDKVIACSRPARRALYDGIATEFRPHQIKCIGQCNHATEETEPLVAEVQGYVDPTCDRFLMPDCGYPPTEAEILEKGVYHRLGTVTPQWSGVVVFHARNRPHQAERNWPMARWQELAQWVLEAGIAERLVCVGTPWQARLVPGCFDARYADLETQMNIGASALCAVGPSSGWMHLASLCGCPHVTWVGEKAYGYVKRRYQDRWNPLKTQVKVLSERTWQPEFAVVRDDVSRLVREMK